MAICCWFNTNKKYTYRVGRTYGCWKVERVIVKECMVCGDKTVEKPTFGSREEEIYYCGTEEEVMAISRLNGIPLLGELE